MSLTRGIAIPLMFWGEIYRLRVPVNIVLLHLLERMVICVFVVVAGIRAFIWLDQGCFIHNRTPNFGEKTNQNLNLMLRHHSATHVIQSV